MGGVLNVGVVHGNNDVVFLNAGRLGRFHHIPHRHAPPGAVRERGFWDSDSTHKPQEVLDTAFALLFLRRSMNGVIHGSVTEPGDAPPEERRGK